MLLFFTRSVYLRQGRHFRKKKDKATNIIRKPNRPEQYRASCQREFSLSLDVFHNQKPSRLSRQFQVQKSLLLYPVSPLPNQICQGHPWAVPRTALALLSSLDVWCDCSNSLPVQALLFHCHSRLGLLFALFNAKLRIEAAHAEQTHSKLMKFSIGKADNFRGHLAHVDTQSLLASKEE